MSNADTARPLGPRGGSDAMTVAECGLTRDASRLERRLLLRGALLRITMPFSIVSLQTGFIHVGLEGDLDAVTVGRLRAELVVMARRQPARVVVDLLHLRSVPPRDIHQLVTVVVDLARAGCRISLTGARDHSFARLNAALVEAIRDQSGIGN